MFIILQESNQDWLLFKLNYSADQLSSFPVSCCKKHVLERESSKLAPWSTRRLCQWFSSHSENKIKDVKSHLPLTLLPILLLWQLLFSCGKCPCFLWVFHLCLSMNRRSINIMLNAWKKAENSLKKQRKIRRQHWSSNKIHTRCHICEFSEVS